MDNMLAKLVLICAVIIAEQTWAQQSPNLPSDVVDLVRDIKFYEALQRGIFLNRNSLTGVFDGDEAFLNKPLLLKIRDYYIRNLGRKKRSTSEDVLKRKKRTALMKFADPLLAPGKWPNGIIHYALDSSLTSQQKGVIYEAVSWWRDSTCLRFVEVNQGDSRPHALFLMGASCVSFVGRTIENIPQPSYVTPDCLQLVGNVAHELGHTIGLWHTHQHPERNDFVNVFKGNMVAPNEGEIVDLPPEIVEDYGGPYDFGSLMHYEPKVFARPGLRVIETRDPNFIQTIGQRSEISFHDAKLVNREYCGATCQNIRISCQNNGYQDPANCARCICPDGWTGNLCTTVDSRRCGGDILVDGRGGSISSPGFDFGQNYPHNILCAWRLRNTVNQNIVFEFDDRFGIYCYGDTAFHWVELRINGTLYDTGYRFCGTQKPRNTFVSVNPDKEVMVVFKSPFNSPNTFVRTGFKLAYRLENQIGCNTNICQNGGTCNQADGVCRCASGFSGMNCEVDNRCAASYCQNGGSCFLTPNGGRLCNCRPGFRGPRCQIANATPAPPPSTPQGDCGACGLPAGQTQVACNHSTETQEYQVRCDSLSAAQFRFYGGSGSRSRSRGRGRGQSSTWCTVELPKKYCCDDSIKLMRVYNDFLCGVPGWGPWSPCSGQTQCGGCGIRRRSQYQVIRQQYRNCYNDRLVTCGQDRTGCDFAPCPTDQCNGNTQREEDDDHSRGRGGGGWFRDLFRTFGIGGGGRGGGRRGNQNTACQNQCCLPYRLSSDGSTCTDGNNPVIPDDGNPVTPSTVGFIEPLIQEPTTQNNLWWWNNNPRTPSTRPPRRRTTTTTTPRPWWESWGDP